MPGKEKCQNKVGLGDRVWVCVDGITIETTHTQVHVHTAQNERVRLWEVPFSPLRSEVL